MEVTITFSIRVSKREEILQFIFIMTPLLPSQKPIRLMVLGDNDFYMSLVCSHLKTNSSVVVEATTSCDDLLSKLGGQLDMIIVDESLEDCKLDELLTVLRLRASHHGAVIELGMNHPGEIAWLAEIAQPTVGLVNNAQREHQEFMVFTLRVVH